jgi:hypothetical protein
MAPYSDIDVYHQKFDQFDQYGQYYDTDSNQYVNPNEQNLLESRLDVRIHEFKLIDRTLCYENSRYYLLIYGLMEVQKWLLELLPTKYQNILSKYVIVTDSKLKSYSYSELKARRSQIDGLNDLYEQMADNLKADIIDELSNYTTNNLADMSVYDLIDLRSHLVQH